MKNWYKLFSYQHYTILVKKGTQDGRFCLIYVGAKLDFKSKSIEVSFQDQEQRDLAFDKLNKDNAQEFGDYLNSKGLAKKFCHAIDFDDFDALYFKEANNHCIELRAKNGESLFATIPIVNQKKANHSFKNFDKNVIFNICQEILKKRRLLENQKILTKLT